MKVDVWADIMCPWCYIGKRRLETALSRFDHADQVDIRWRSFELRPDQPSVPRDTLGEIMQRYRGLSPDMVTKQFQWIHRLGAAEGLDINLDTIRPVRSFDAHRLIQLAQDQESNLGDRMAEQLFLAYLTENKNVADHDVLVSVGQKAGMAAEAIRTALSGETYAETVRKDEHIARQSGISAIPTFVVEGGNRVSGAPTVDDMLTMLREGMANHLRTANRTSQVTGGHRDQIS